MIFAAIHFVSLHLTVLHQGIWKQHWVIKMIVIIELGKFGAEHLQSTSRYSPGTFVQGLKESVKGFICCISIQDLYRTLSCLNASANLMVQGLSLSRNSVFYWNSKVHCCIY
jgi:hypothetical protein